MRDPRDTHVIAWPRHGLGVTHRPCEHGGLPTRETAWVCSPFGVGLKPLNPLKRACFVLAVLIAAPGVASGLQALEPLQDWDRVHQLRPGSRVVVKLFKGMGRKVAGSYASSDEVGIALHSPAGQTQAIPRERIRAVVWKRRMRWAPAKGAAVGFGAGAALMLLGHDLAQPFATFIFGGVGAGIGAAGRSARPCCRRTRSSLWSIETCSTGPEAQR